MFYVFGWFLVLILLALWSLAAWSFHAITTWTASNAGALAGGSGAIETLRWPDWLAPWIPAELTLMLTSTLTAFKPAIDAILEQSPALAGGFSVAVWLVWGIGSVLLIVIGAVSHGLFALLRRRLSRAASGYSSAGS